MIIRTSPLNLDFRITLVPYDFKNYNKKQVIFQAPSKTRLYTRFERHLKQRQGWVVSKAHFSLYLYYYFLKGSSSGVPGRFSWGSKKAGGRPAFLLILVFWGGAGQELQEV